MSNSCTGDSTVSTNAPENLDRTKGAFHWSTSKAKKHPLAKAPFRQARPSDSPNLSPILSTLIELFDPGAERPWGREALGPRGLGNFLTSRVAILRAWHNCQNSQDAQKCLTRVRKGVFWPPG